jgi:hypothetical protein
MAKAAAALPPDFIGPPTADQAAAAAKAAAKKAYAAAPGQERPTSLDTDGARTTTEETYSVVKKIAVAQNTANNAADKKTPAKDKKPAWKVTNKEFDDALAKYDTMTPAEKTAAYKQWQNGLLGDLDNAQVGDTYADGNGGTGSLNQKQVDALQGASQELKDAGWVGQEPGNSDALATMLAKHKKEYNSFQIPFWNIKGQHGHSVWDAFWQSDTSVGLVGYKDPDGGKDPDPRKTPYLVADGKKFKAGDFAYVTAPNGNSTWMRVMDANGKKGVVGNEADGRQAEMSPAAYQALGYPGAIGMAPPVGHVKVQAYPGSGGGDQIGYLTPEETQEAGARIKDKTVKSIANKDELEKARTAKEEKDKKDAADPKKAKAKKADAGKAAGIPIVVAARTVFAGQLQRQVGIASPTCVHEGGGYLAQGSDSVTVENCPLPRIGDKTSDNLYVVWGQLDVLSA